MMVSPRCGKSVVSPMGTISDRYQRQRQRSINRPEYTVDALRHLGDGVVVFLVYFLLGCSCFTTPCQFLRHNEVNQLYVRLCLLPSAPPSLPSPLPPAAPEVSTERQAELLCYTEGSPQLSLHCLRRRRHGSRLSVHRQMNGQRRRGTFTMEHYPAITRNETGSFAVIQVDLEDCQSEGSQKERNMLMHTGSLCSSDSKESACNAGDSPGSMPGSGRSSWRREWQPTPVFLPGESHGFFPRGSQRVGHD